MTAGLGWGVEGAGGFVHRCSSCFSFSPVVDVLLSVRTERSVAARAPTEEFLCLSVCLPVCVMWGREGVSGVFYQWCIHSFLTLTASASVA